MRGALNLPAGVATIAQRFFGELLPQSDLLTLPAGEEATKVQGAPKIFETVVFWGRVISATRRATCLHHCLGPVVPCLMSNPDSRRGCEVNVKRMGENIVLICSHGFLRSRLWGGGGRGWEGGGGWRVKQLTMHVV